MVLEIGINQVGVGVGDCVGGDVPAAGNSLAQKLWLPKKERRKEKRTRSRGKRRVCRRIECVGKRLSGSKAVACKKKKKRKKKEKKKKK